MDNNSPNVQLFCADVYEILSKYRFSAHCVLTDPPYAMGDSGFMNYAWDKQSPAMSPEFWKLLSQNLLPGALVLCFSSNLKAHKTVIAAEQFDFELLNTIIWARATTIKLGRNHPIYPTHKTGKQAIRTGHEVILIFQKHTTPLSKTACLSQYGTGGFHQNITDLAKYNVITHQQTPNLPSRIFYPLHAPNEIPDIIYVPKTSAQERDAGLENLPEGNYGIYKFRRDNYITRRKNPHPTVKPLALTRFLAQLIVPPPSFQATLLVPFAGTGSEMIGGIWAGFHSVFGIEIDAQYTTVAEQRIRHFTGVQCKVTPG